MRKSRIAFLAAGMALSLAGAVAAASPAAAGGGTQTTLRLLDTPTSTFGFPLTPTAGETFGLHGTVAAAQASGKVIGEYSLVCTIVEVNSTRTAMTTSCTTVHRLTQGPYGRGQISTRGMDTLPVAQNNVRRYSDIVTGGTGAFNAVGGSVSITDRPQQSAQVVFTLTYP